MRIPLYRCLVAFLVACTLPLAGRAVPPLVRVVESSGPPHVTLQWVVPGTHWLSTVETRENLPSADWIAAPGAVWPNASTNWTDPRPASQGGRFYRVIATPPPANRGRMVSNHLAATISPLILQFLLQSYGLPFTATYSVDYYSVIYETVDPYGAPILASGAVLLPSGARHAAPLLCYDHGTSILRDDVPSRANTEGYLGAGLATDGYVVALPDYLGLGDSPGFHPFLHAESEATATVDILRVARALCASNSVALNGQVFLSGYSQGGHAAVATLRELEATATNEFTVTACGAGSGPYDLAGVSATDFLSGRAAPNPYFFLYLLGAAQDVYGLAPSLADLLAPPYNATLPPLLDGQHDDLTINAAMPSSAISILSPAALADFKNNPANPLRLALLDNTLLNWVPRAPLRLYACSGDQDVVPANSQAAYDSFHAHGATQVQLSDPKPGANHDNCAVPSLVAIKTWFDSLRR